jgi:hypothetical protein
MFLQQEQLQVFISIRLLRDQAATTTEDANSSVSGHGPNDDDASIIFLLQKSISF